MNANQSAGRKLDTFLRIVTVAFALTLIAITTPLVLADHMGNHERGGTNATECGTETTEATETQGAVTVDPLRASIHRHGPKND